MFFEHIAKFHAWKTVHEWNGHLEILGSPQVIENSRQYLLLRTAYFTENSRWVPLPPFHGLSSYFLVSLSITIIIIIINRKLTLLTEVTIKWSLAAVTRINIVIIQTFSPVLARMFSTCCSTTTLHVISISCQLAQVLNLSINSL